MRYKFFKKKVNNINIRDERVSIEVNNRYFEYDYDYLIVLILDSK